MVRAVMHLNMSDFPIEVERLVDPTLRGRPVVISPPSPRARLLSVSAEARSMKIKQGMYLSDALRHSREIRVVSPNQRLYFRVRDNVLQILSRYSPLVEPSDLGSAFIDLSGTERLFGPARDTAFRINREIRKETNLNAGLGLSANKSTSEVASGVARNELLSVFPGGERTFLAPQPALLLPGTEKIDPKLLEELNIRRISQFAHFPLEQLNLVFGKLGPILHLRARGLDPRPVRPQEKRPSVFEEYNLPDDTNDREELTDRIRYLVERCGFRLRSMGKRAAVLQLMIVYSDYAEAEGTAWIEPPSNLDNVIFQATKNLFARILKRRVRVSYLSVSCNDLASPSHQMSFFQCSADETKESSLLGALDEIRTRFGVSSVNRGLCSCRTLST